MAVESEAEISESKHETSKRIMFVATTPFAVNAFLAGHLKSLSKYYAITLCVNLHSYALDSQLKSFVEVVNIDFERKISPLIDVVSFVRLFFLIRRVRPVSIHSITPKAGLFSMLAGFLARVPNRWHTFTGQIWSTRRGLSRFVLKCFDRIIVIFSTQVFADSVSQCCFLRDEKIVSGNGISVLGPGSISGVDIERFHPNQAVRSSLRNESGSGDETCIFLFVGRLTQDKGVFDLLCAYGKVIELFSGVELWMVGPDEDELMSELEKKGQPLDASVKWMGSTVVPEHYMMAADVLVLPSYREGFGLVLIEAAACGLPVVAYRVDGVIDAVEDGVSGLLVECGNSEILSEKLLLLAADPNMRRTLGKKGRKRVAQHFRSDAIADAWRAKYHSHLLD